MRENCSRILSQISSAEWPHAPPCYAQALCCPAPAVRSESPAAVVSPAPVGNGSPPGGDDAEQSLHFFLRFGQWIRRKIMWNVERFNINVTWWASSYWVTLVLLGWKYGGEWVWRFSSILLKIMSAKLFLKQLSHLECISSQGQFIN